MKEAEDGCNTHAHTHTHTQKSQLFVLLTILVVGGVRTAAAVPTQWTVASGGNDHYYEAVISLFNGRSISWADANNAAQDRGGYLATIQSLDENTFVYGLITGYEYWHGAMQPATSFTGPWLGGMQMPNSVEPAGGWTWVTGEPWTYTNWHLNWGGVDLPDNVDNADKLHFVQVWSSTSQSTPYWDDLRDIPSGSDSGPVAYIVEWVPEPSTAILLAFGAVAVSFFGQRLNRSTT